MLKKGLIALSIFGIILFVFCAFIFIPRTNADKEDFSYNMNVSYIGESKIIVTVELKNESFHTIRYASNVGGPIFVECIGETESFSDDLNSGCEFGSLLPKQTIVYSQEYELKEEKNQIRALIIMSFHLNNVYFEINREINNKDIEG